MLHQFKTILIDEPAPPICRKQPEALNASGALLSFSAETSLITKHLGELITGQDKH